MSDVKIGVIGGSGLYEIEGLTDIEEVSLDNSMLSDNQHNTL